jgi:hypothetical protein
VSKSKRDTQAQRFAYIVQRTNEVVHVFVVNAHFSTQMMFDRKGKAGEPNVSSQNKFCKKDTHP